MGYLIEDRERIPITEEEYNRNQYFPKDNSFKEMLKSVFYSNNDYIKEPIYESGILNQVIGIDPIGYKYYKLGKRKSIYLCGSEEYKALQEKGVI